MGLRLMFRIQLPQGRHPPRRRSADLVLCRHISPPWAYSPCLVVLVSAFARMHTTPGCLHVYGLPICTETFGRTRLSHYRLLTRPKDHSYG